MPVRLWIPTGLWISVKKKSLEFLQKVHIVPDRVVLFKHTQYPFLYMSPEYLALED